MKASAKYCRLSHPVVDYWKSEFASRQTAAHTVYFRRLIKAAGFLMSFYWLCYELVQLIK